MADDGRETGKYGPFLDHHGGEDGQMRRVVLTALGLVALAAAVIVVATTSGGGAHPYRVRAIFDDAAFAVQGEEVRIAGAPVGTIVSLGVTDASGRGSASACTLHHERCLAAVTVQINNSAFTPFRANAACAIRPQSLIGEKYVDCNPGTAGAPALQHIPNGPGAGTYLLPLTHTSSPVDTDLVQNIYREPVRQMFAVIINELGTGLAARGSDLNDVIHRANPALGYTDQVLQILARQNRQLAQLARDSDVVLTPLARERAAIREWVIQANTTSVASAARANDIRQSFHLLPAFLLQLRPLLVDLSSLSDQATPVLNTLSRAAPALAQQYEALAPFAGVARKSLISLGAAAVQQQPLLLQTIPLAQRLLKLGNAGYPAFTSLDRLLSSLDNTGGIEQLMGLLFNGANAANGFDSLGHYIRTEALVGSCTGYAKVTVPGCSANFTHMTAAADVARTVRDARASGIKPGTTAALGGLLDYLVGSPR
jgi:ABC-type transporter Mla subunit MlaD